MDNFFESIQDYLDGALSPEEHQRFERELERNEPLLLETDNQRMLREVLGKQVAAAPMIPLLRNTLKEVSDRHFGSVRKKKKITVVRWLAPLAAAAVILVVVNFMGWFAADYDALPPMPSSVTRGAVDDSAVSQATEAYNVGDYLQSIGLFRQLMAADPTVARYPYYLGLSYIGNEDYQRAIEQLQAVADGKSVFAEDACYFTAVALWKLGKDKEALVYMRKVTEASEYYRKAEKLRNKLDN
ncbi:tetratricopeptide repeat protein [Parapedobacter sp. 2B3]|uniref:tetratricopeptide repeat protein n=1 Tax=Parapedobacter sp. 2B3 TaxID=3342381 RepID=UPI0035B629A5